MPSKGARLSPAKVQAGIDQACVAWRCVADRSQDQDGAHQQTGKVLEGGRSKQASKQAIKQTSDQCKIEEEAIPCENPEGCTSAATVSSPIIVISRRSKGAGVNESNDPESTASAFVVQMRRYLLEKLPRFNLLPKTGRAASVTGFKTLKTRRPSPMPSSMISTDGPNCSRQVHDSAPPQGRRAVESIDRSNLLFCLFCLNWDGLCFALLPFDLRFALCLPLSFRF